jgi:uroporphyrinogen-III synthase
MRETTAEAYRKAKESGLIKGLKLQVFHIICTVGPITANELRSRIDDKSNSGVYSTRLSELERMGVIRGLEKRKCRVTGNMAIEWEATGEPPRKVEKPATKEEKKEMILKKLRALYVISAAEQKTFIEQIGKDIKEL